MTYRLKYTQTFEKQIEKIKKKDRTLTEEAMKKVEKLREMPYTGKPLEYRLALRPLGQFVLKITLNTITKNRYSDQECGFRALSRRAMEIMNFKFRGKGFSVEAEMIRLAEKHGLKTLEVPITEIYVENGSTLNPWRHGFGNLGTIITWISENENL